MTTKDKTYANLRISTKIEHKYWLKFLFLERKKKDQIKKVKKIREWKKVSYSMKNDEWSQYSTHKILKFLYKNQKCSNLRNKKEINAVLTLSNGAKSLILFNLWNDMNYNLIYGIPN